MNYTKSIALALIFCTAINLVAMNEDSTSENYTKGQKLEYLKRFQNNDLSSYKALKDIKRDDKKSLKKQLKAVALQRENDLIISVFTGIFAGVWGSISLDAYLENRPLISVISGLFCSASAGLCWSYFNFHRNSTKNYNQIKNEFDEYKKIKIPLPSREASDSEFESEEEA